MYSVRRHAAWQLLQLWKTWKHKKHNNEIIMKLKNLLISVAAVASLTACSNDNNMMEGAAIPTFTGTIAGQTATRMAGTAWDEGDSIGITASSSDNETSASNVKYVTANGDGAFSPAEGVNPITFGSTQKATFSAYYPYTANSGTVSVSTAAANQTAANQKSIDFLYASGATANIVRPEVKFQFNHVMSQLVLNIKAGTGVTDLSKLTKIALGNLKLGGTFNTATGATSATGNASSMEFATTIASGTTSFEESLILLPQSVSDSKLSLTLTYNNMEYSASLTLADGLASGYSTTYNVTLNKTSVNVSGGSINPWNSSTLTAEATELNYFVTADKAELYALAFTDGTYLNVWNSSRGAIDSNMWSVYEKSTSYKTPCGVVYWLSKDDLTPLTNDKLLASEHPECTHGYIVALQDVEVIDGTPARYNWGYYSEENTHSVSNIIDAMESKSKPSSYEPIYIETDNVDKLNSAFGYNNSRLLRIYNEEYCVGDNEQYKVVPMEKIDLFAAQNEAPDESSGWYLPSPRELVWMIKDGESTFNDSSTGKNYSTKHVEHVGAVLKKLLPGAPGLSEWYWTSSEFKQVSKPWGSSVYETYWWAAWYVAFFSDTFGNVGVHNKSTNGVESVRAVCAF
jgi:hypothetical protein